ncbi:MIR domain-containing protein [Plasmodiophora brassicae]|uniref:MIR domain-containing protein n=1 Tax=Plasmodiophora brassicae TaxID=37360 RepID=A0A3P3YC92_PLABS|nr:unnamed protein product [Plasmodiophora brassicae]
MTRTTTVALRAAAAVVVACICFGGALGDDDHDDDHMSEFPVVTMLSAVQLLHSSGYRLHSHPISYGSGSGQQSVTALKGAANHENLFQVHNADKEPVVAAGSPVKCGSVVRLRHVATKKWLHSHLHDSPISKNQEVSCFGDAGQSDTGDNWRVQCSGENWTRDADVQLVHVDTNTYLSARLSNMFTQGNCPGCPINGQLEVYCQRSSSDQQTKWKTAEGVFFRPSGK